MQNQSDFYKQVDKVNEYLQKQYIKQFNKYSNIAKFDALNVIEKSKKLYDGLYKVTAKAYFTMASKIYRDYTGEDLFEAWITGVLTDYDPVTKYQFKSEWERKRARFAESMIASGAQKDLQTALRLLTRQAMQGSFTIADDAQKKAYKDSGIKEVIWITEDDEKVCLECKRRHNVVYRIDKVPDKPHFMCRCMIIPK